MFTGLIQNLGLVQPKFNARLGKIGIQTPLSEKSILGESIAVNGVCLTIVKIENQVLIFDLSPETIERTSLAQLSSNAQVNLEASLRLGDRLGGHFVQGHVDGVGEVRKLERQGEYFRVLVAYPHLLSKFFVQKGSVAVDGVSLTINHLSDPDIFELMIIPHTWKETVFQYYREGSKVNLEVDILGKYVDRHLSISKEAKVS